MKKESQDNLLNNLEQLNNQIGSYVDGSDQSLNILSNFIGNGNGDVQNDTVGEMSQITASVSQGNNNV